VFGNSPSVWKNNRKQTAPACEHLLSYAVQKAILRSRADNFELIGHSGMSLKPSPKNKTPFQFFSAFLKIEGLDNDSFKHPSA
jgi:hypothetical protein